MQGFTIEQLESLKLFPVYGKSAEPDYFLDFDNPFWEGDIAQYLVDVADPAKRTPHALYKRCTSATKLGLADCFYNIEHFDMTRNGVKVSWSPNVKAIKNLATRTQKQQLRTKNIAILRMYAMGDVEARIVCPMLKVQIDDIELFGHRGNAWVQHHFRFMNGASFHKENADPGAILSSTDFSIPSTRSRMGIEDMARTIFLSSTAHDFLHKSKRDGDIMDYTNAQLPWALRNEDNWNTFNMFLSSYGYAPLGDYQTWFNEQKN